MLSPRLHQFLDKHQAPYTTLAHPRTVTAQETANAAHIGNLDFAKTVMLKVDGVLAMMVMPAAYRVDLTRLSRALGGPVVELAEESEFKDAFPDCEVGAMPPFGNLYGLPVFVDSRLADQSEIAFNAGSHIDALCMPYAELLFFGRHQRKVTRQRRKRFKASNNTQSACPNCCRNCSANWA